MSTESRCSVPYGQAPSLPAKSTDGSQLRLRCQGCNLSGLSSNLYVFSGSGSIVSYSSWKLVDSLTAEGVGLFKFA